MLELAYEALESGMLSPLLQTSYAVSIAKLMKK
jgi:hypothetical protein